MTKRRANTVKGRDPEFSAIESQAVNLESIDQDAYLQETANEDDGIQGLNSSDEQVDEGEENLPQDVDSKLNSTLRTITAEVNQPPRTQQERSNTSMLVQEESCLGYLYPKRVDMNASYGTFAYGSRLGRQASGSNIENRQKRVPGVSNLESLMTYPKKIYAKSGALLGFSNVKYPKSIYEEILERKRVTLRELKTLISPSVREREKMRHSAQDLSKISNEDISIDSSIAIQNEKVAPVQIFDSTPKISEINGWGPTDQTPGSGAVSRQITSLVQSTRVGGATFVKNTTAINQSLNVTQTSSQFYKDIPSKNLDALELKRKQQKSRVNMSESAIKRQKKKSNQARQVFQEPQTPLQLANLNVLIANLEKTGNLQQANEEAFRIKQRKERKFVLGLKPHQAYAQHHVAVRPNGAISSNKTGVDPSETRKSFYFADDRGNLMRITKSTIFDMTNDHQFVHHRLMPTLEAYQNEAELSSYQNIQIDSKRNEPVRNTAGVIVNRMYSQNVVQVQLNTDSAANLASTFAEERLSTKMLEPQSAIDDANSSSYLQHTNSGGNMSQFCVVNGDGKAVKQAIKSPFSLDETSFKRSPNIQTEVRLTQNQTAVQKGLTKHIANLAAMQWPTFGGQPTSEGVKNMMVQGGQLTMSQKNLQQNKIRDLKQLSVLRQSNKDLRELDQKLTIIPAGQCLPMDIPVAQAYSGLDDKQLQNTETLVKELETTGQNFAKTPRLDNDSSKWKVLQSTKFFDYKNLTNDASFVQGVSTANFTRVITSSIPPETIASQSHRKVSNQSHGSGGSIPRHDTSRGATPNNLPSMLQIMKQKTINQAVLNKNFGQVQAEYGVEGRSISQPPPQPGANSNRGAKQAKLSQKRRSKDQFTQHQIVQGEFTSQKSQSVSRQTAVLPMQLATGGLIPIFIANRSVNEDPQQTLASQQDASPQVRVAHIKTTTTTEQDGEIKVVEQPISATNQQSFIYKSLDLDKKGGRRKKQNEKMRFADYEYNAGEVYTVLGEPSIAGMKINDGRSRYKLTMQQDTMKLEDTSSKQLEKDGEGAQSKTKIGVIHSPKTQISNNAENFHSRQIIPIQRSSDELQPTRQVSLDSMSKEMTSRQLQSVEAAQKNTDGYQSFQAMKRNLDPLDIEGIIFLQNGVNSTESLIAIQSINSKPIVQAPEIASSQATSSPVVIAINQKNSKQLGQSIKITSYQAQKSPKIEVQESSSSLPVENNASYSTGTFNKKRSTQGSVQRLEHHSIRLNKMQFNNSNISSVKIGAINKDEKQKKSPKYAATSNQGGFLPKMPFKQSNFAKTQKAIKRLREGPANQHRRRGEDAASGQFMRINDYAAMHGQYANGDPRNYLASPQDTGRQQSTKIASEANYSNSVEDIEQKLFASSTSFGKLLKAPVPFRISQQVFMKRDDTSGDDYPKIIEDQYQSKKVEEERGNVNTPSTANIGGSKKQVIQRQSSMILTDYTTTQRRLQEVTHDNIPEPTISDSEKKMLIIRDTNFPEKTQNVVGNKAAFISTQGSITIKRASPSIPSSILGETQERRRSSNLDSPKNMTQIQVQKQSMQMDKQKLRQVVIYKVNMAAPLTDAERGMYIHSGGRMSISNNLTPNDGSGIDATDGTSNHYLGMKREQGDSRVGSPAISFAVRKGYSQNMFMPKQKQSRSNIINLGLLPNFSNNSDLNIMGNVVGQLQDAMASTAQKFMNNSEAKARMFIDKQRKRTANLGAQRQQKFIYVVGGQEMAKEEKKTVGQDKSGSGAVHDQRSILEVDKAYISPPVLDITGDSLYNSGMLIQKAPVNEPRYITNRQSRHQPKAKIISKNTNESLDSTASLNADRIDPHQTALLNTSLKTAVGLPTARSPSTLNSQPVAGIKHKAFNSNQRLASSQLLSPSPQRSSTQTPKKETSQDLNTAQDNGNTQALILKGQQIRQAAETLLQSNDDMYGDYIRGAAASFGEPQVASRAKTPIPDSSGAGAMKLQEKRFNELKGKMISNAPPHVMSSETLAVIQSKSDNVSRANNQAEKSFFAKSQMDKSIVEN